MRNFLLLIAGAILIGLLSFVCFANKLKPITDDIITRTQAELNKNHIYGLDVSMVGSGYKTKLFTKLSGTVLSQEEKQKALDIAKNIYGVYGVEDALTVETPKIIKRKLVFEPVLEEKPDISKKQEPQEKKQEIDKCQTRLNKLLSKSKINFQSAKTNIKEDSYSLLDQIASIIKECEDKGIKIVIEGYTDSSGKERSNLILSQERAESVKSYLVNKHKLSEKLFKAVGYGSAKPIADNNTKEGRAKNRRIEFKIEGVTK